MWSVISFLSLSTGKATDFGSEKQRNKRMMDCDVYERMPVRFLQILQVYILFFPISSKTIPISWNEISSTIIPHFSEYFKYFPQ